MDNKQALHYLLETLDEQQAEIIRLKDREIELLRVIQRLEHKNRDIMKAIRAKVFDKKP
jgi:hypothetical protein